MLATFRSATAPKAMRIATSLAHLPVRCQIVAITFFLLSVANVLVFAACPAGLLLFERDPFFSFSSVKSVPLPLVVERHSPTTPCHDHEFAPALGSFFSRIQSSGRRDAGLCVAVVGGLTASFRYTISGGFPNDLHLVSLSLVKRPHSALLLDLPFSLSQMVVRFPVVSIGWLRITSS